MDCEKFETTLIDELYDELDELTSAAAKRHVAGCARCAALLGGLRATRRVAVLPQLEPPADLEERILAAAKNAQKVVPLRARLSRAVSRAGSWAMRPQTAMAAVFLLMIGSSVLLIRGRQKSPASMTVTEEGAPAPVAASAIVETQVTTEATAAASNAHGPLEKGGGGRAANAPHSQTLAGEADRANDDLAPSLDFARRNEQAESERAEKKDGRSYALSDNAGIPGGAPNALPPAAVAQGATRSGGDAEDKSAFGGAMTAFRAGRYDEAAQSFGGLGRAGDVNAAYWAARSVRAGSGKCAQAAPLFDRVATSAGGSALGNQALLDAGQCYRIAGRYDEARARLTRLAAIPEFESRARAELQAMPQAAQAAAAKAAPRTVTAAPKAPAAPAPQATTMPAAKPADVGYR